MKLLMLVITFGFFTALNSSAVITNKVWLVVYDPFPTNSGKAHLWDVYDTSGTWTLWNDPLRQNTDLCKLIQMDTHSNVVVICTKTNILRKFPLLSNGESYYYDANGPDEQNNYYYSYVSPWDQDLYSSMLDYDYMLTNDLDNAEEIMGTGVCDQMYVWAAPGCGGYESHMFGPGSWWCNSWGHTGNNGYRNYPRRWIVWVYNYERGTDMANHNHGHMTESHMSHFTSGYNWNYATREDSSKRLDNYWNTFAAVNAWHPGNAHVGDCHRMPNSTSDYDYHNSSYVTSYHLSWLNENFLSWPNLTLHEQVNVDTWNDTALENSIYESEGECSHLRWWFQHMPHLDESHPNYMTNGVLMNWYEYLWNYNFCGLELQEGAERYDGPYVDLRGYLSYYITVPPSATEKLTIEVHSDQNVDLFVRKDYVAVPQGHYVAYSAYDISAESPDGHEIIEITPSSSPPLSPGRWYITVHAPYSSSLIRGDVRVRAYYNAVPTAPGISVPCIVSPADSGSYMGSAGDVVVTGWKATGTWVYVNGTTNNVTQVLSTTNWQTQVTVDAFDSVELSCTAHFPSGRGSVATGVEITAIDTHELCAYDGAHDGVKPSLQDYAGGYGWNSLWVDNNKTESGSLYYTNNLKQLVTMGDRFFITGGESHRTLDTAAYPHLTSGGYFAPNGTSLWYSFILKQEDDVVNTSFGGLYINNNSGNNLYIGKVWDAAKWRIEGTDGITLDDVVTTDNIPTFFVVRIDFQSGNDDVNVWVNPLLADTPPSDTEAYVYSSIDIQFDGIFLAAGNATFSCDEFRLGESWDAVTPTTPIPEPVAGCIALSLIALLALRKQT